MKAGRLAALLLLTVAALIGVSGGPAAATAPEISPEGWSINYFDASYEIRPDGSVDVTEDILIDFSGLDLQGIRRYLPLELPIGPDAGQRRVVDIDVKSVSDKTEPVSFRTERQGESLVLLIDPDCTCRAQLQYTIVYTLRGALEQESGGAAFRWDVTGEWPVNIIRVGARVTAPAIEDASCTAVAGDTEQVCVSRVTGAGEAQFSSGRLPYGGSLSIDLTLPPGAVEVPAPVLVAHNSSLIDRDLTTAALLAVGLAVLVVVGLLARERLRRDA